MKKAFFVIALAIIAVLVLVGAGVVYAQTTTPTNPQQQSEDEVPQYPNRGGFFGFRGGNMGHMGGQFVSEDGHGPLHETMIQSMAQALGIGPEELEARLDSGETMYAIAESLGFSAEEFNEVMVAARSSAIEQAVAEGLITQEMGDWMLERMSSMQSFGYGPGTGDCPGHTTGGMRGNRGQGGMRFSSATP